MVKEPEPFKTNLWAVRWGGYSSTSIPGYLREMADFIEQQGHTIDVDMITFDCTDGYELTLYYEKF